MYCHDVKPTVSRLVHGDLWEFGEGRSVLSLTMNPTAPMTPKPMPTAWHSLRNSFLSATVEKDNAR